MVDVFEAPLKTIRWAKANLEAFDAIARKSVEEASARRSIEGPDSDGFYSGYIHFEVDVDELEKFANQASIHVRHAFDQTMYALAVRFGGRVKPSPYFPWVTGPSDLEGRFSSELQFLPEDIKGLIRSLAPYKSTQSAVGNDLLRAFASAINPAKHSVPIAMTLEGRAAPAKIYVSPSENHIVVRTPVDPLDITNGKLEVMRFKNIAPDQIELQIFARYSFADGDIQGESVETTVSSAIEHAERFISDCRPFL